jgi:hypothetical protein
MGQVIDSKKNLKINEIPILVQIKARLIYNLYTLYNVCNFRSVIIKIVHIDPKYS